MAIASTTGKPSMNSTRNPRTTRKPSIPSGQHSLLRFGAPCAPGMHQHGERLDRQQQRPDHQGREEQPERHLQDRRHAVQVATHRHDRGDEKDAEDGDAGNLDRQLQQPARSRRHERLELLHTDLPALARHVRAGKEGEADQEILGEFLRAGERHVEHAPHRDLRERRDDERGEEDEARPPDRRPYELHAIRFSYFTARICSMYLPHSGKSLFTCASTDLRKPSTSSPSFCSTKIMPFASRSWRYLAAVSRSQSSVFLPTSTIVSSMILRSAAGSFWYTPSLMNTDRIDCMWPVSITYFCTS